MSLKYMGVPNFCKHFKSEDHCELCNLEKQVKQLQAEIDRLRALEDELATLIDESHGVSGYHLNGHIAAWKDLLPGGRFEYLKHFNEVGGEG